MTKKYLLTFGGGGQNYIDAVNRLSLQASQTKLFDQILTYIDDDLKKDDDFWSKHNNFILHNKHGYGYWIWKPYLIKKTMEYMNDGDILLYLDAGCEIDIKKKDILNNFLNYVKDEYIIASFACIEKDWNKMDLLLKLDMNHDKYLNAAQRAAGLILFLVCDKTRKLVNEWYELSCDYHLIDDSPSISQNLPCFKEHRHDQSIFSLLTKKYNIYTDKGYCLRSGCFKNDIRNKSGKSKLK